MYNSKQETQMSSKKLKQVLSGVDWLADPEEQKPELALFTDIKASFLQLSLLLRNMRCRASRQSHTNIPVAFPVFF